MKYKASTYNNIIDKRESDTAFLVYNASSGAVSWLDNEIIQAFKDDNVEALCDKSYFADLVRCKYIVPQNINEYEEQIFNMTQYIFNPSVSSIVFTIAPTMACNLKCIYCFEQGRNRNEIVTEEMCNKIFDFICHQIDKNGNIKNLNIVWFGGEPVLAYKRIEELSMKLISYCIENSIEFSSSMITNGTLLTDEIIVGLRDKCKLKHIQITFDGDSDYYMLYKNTGKENFEKAYKNAWKIMERKIPVSIRLNVSDENKDSILRIAQKFSEGNFTGKIYLAKLFKYNDGSPYEEISDDDFNEIEKKVFAVFDNDIKKVSQGKKLLYPHKAGCGAMACNNCTIGTDGKLYRCEHHINDENFVVGDIDAGFYHNKIDNQFLMAELPVNCQTCSIFPICKGGCVSNRLFYGKDVECGAYKKRIYNHIELLCGNK